MRWPCRRPWWGWAAALLRAFFQTFWRGLAVAGVALALFMEWRWSPFKVDDSLSYFLTHLQNLQGMTLFMIALSGVFGFWFGRGRSDQTDADE